VSVDDWDQRELCPDGACTGVIGPDGTCKVCGRAAPNWGDERKRGLLPDPDAADEDEDDELDDEADGDGDEADDDDEPADDDEAAASDEVPDAEWSERKLCDDGACVGVIGKDGVCNVCGKRSAAA
jgi:hypothetical protein